MTAAKSHFDLVAHLERQRAFSLKTFGPGTRAAGVVDHIRKELCEIEADPTDIEEWIDVIILAFDGAWRAGYEPAQIVKAIVSKQTKNEKRGWPDWRTADPDKAIEHDRSADCPKTSADPLDGMEERVSAYFAAHLPASRQTNEACARPLDEWHEDYGLAVWWTWQGGRWLGEPSYIGSPLCSDWPGYHTHWTPHPDLPPAPQQPAP